MIKLRFLHCLTQGSASKLGTRSRAIATRYSRLRLTAALYILFATPCYAYLDPGTGSILLQGLLAGVASAIAFGGFFWKRIKLFFTSLFSSRSKSDLDSEDNL